MKPHKHAEIIKAWADGAEIQSKIPGGDWSDCSAPRWYEGSEYRIKPKPKPDFYDYYNVSSKIGIVYYGKNTAHDLCNLKLTFDGETGLLKKAEVI